MLSFFITAPLAWLGIVDLASVQPEGPVTAFRLSAWGQALLAGETPRGLPAEEERLIIRSDACLHAPRLTPRSVRYQMARFCQWEKESPDGYDYRLTPTSLARASQQGLAPQHLLSLPRKSAEALPPSLVKALERWEVHGSQARIESLSVLVTAERNKLETILAGIQDGVIVVDQDQRLGLVNKAARQIFSTLPENPSDIPFREVVSQPELLDLLSAPEDSPTNRTELSPDEDHVFSVQVTPIQGVGRVLTLHDITNLKKLDRIKTEFVHTVSHDLRSPLTAILDYVELIGRAGPVTDLQRDFIRRVQMSVQNITHLVDDLLDLGRIESGFDLRKENVLLDRRRRGSRTTARPRA